MPSNTGLKFEQQKIAQICQQLVEQGYSVIVDFLPTSIAQALLDEVSNSIELDFKPAAIGREQDLQINSKVRTDSIAWLEGGSPAQASYLGLMEELRIELNRHLYMGLFDFESHYAHYRPGDFYQRHVDSFRGRSNRLLSSVLYLNHHWQPIDGGELLIFRDEQLTPFLILPPVFNQCVLFLSEQFPHEVRVAKRHRYSIAGWFRTNASIGGQLDPPL